MYRQKRMAMRDLRATKLIGSEVRNAQGDNLGEVKAEPVRQCTI